MGSGASKSKNSSKPNKVSADIVVPGHSKPVKVKGHVQLPQDGQTNGNGSQKSSLPSGPAQVKQVAPNTYNLHMGDHNVGVSNLSTILNNVFLDYNNLYYILNYFLKPILCLNRSATVMSQSVPRTQNKKMYEKTYSLTHASAVVLKTYDAIYSVVYVLES